MWLVTHAKLGASRVNCPPERVPDKMKISTLIAVNVLAIDPHEILPAFGPTIHPHGRYPIAGGFVIQDAPAPRLPNPIETIPKSSDDTTPPPLKNGNENGTLEA